MSKLAGFLSKRITPRPRNKVSWVVGALVAAGMTLIVVPGEPVSPRLVYQPAIADLNAVGMGMWQPPPRPAPWSVLEYSHGWPFEWLRRGRGFNGPDWPQAKGVPLINSRWFDAETDKPPVTYRALLSYGEWKPISWSIPDAWMLDGDMWDFSPVAFVFDFLLLFAIPFAAVAACNSLIASGERFWRISLRTVLIGLTGFSLALGWWQYHIRGWDQEHALLREIGIEPYERGFMRAGNVNYAYNGPRWLSRLVGSERVIRFCWHIDDLSIPVTELSADDLNRVRELPWVTRLRIEGPDYPDYPDCPEPPPRLDSSTVAKALGEARQVRYLHFDRLSVFREDLVALCELDSLMSLDASCTFITSADLAELRAEHSEIQIISNNKYCELLSQLDVYEKRLLVAGAVVDWGYDPAPSVDGFSEEDAIVGIDFSGAEVSDDLIKRISPLARTVEWLRFDSHIDSSLAFDFAISCRHLCTLQMHQGDLTKKRLIAWLGQQKRRELYINLYNVTLGEAGVQAIYGAVEGFEEVGGDFTLDMFRGSPGEEDDTYIEPASWSAAPSTQPQSFEPPASPTIDPFGEEDPFADF